MKFPDPARTIARQDEDTLLAMLVWGEARSEPAEGRLAVAYVPLTRFGSPSWKSRKRGTSSLSDVILAKFQFSCFNPLDPNREKLLRPVEHEGLGLWAACWQSANAALRAQSENPVPGATHYVVRRLWARPAVDATKPQWFEKPMIDNGTTTRLAVIGSHVFARTR